MNQSFWTAKVDGSFNEDEVSYGSSSRAEPKRSHQWFADAPEVGLFPNKRQAVGAPNTNSFQGMLNPNSAAAAWGHGPGFHPISGLFSERLFDPEGDRNENLEDRTGSLVSLDKLSKDQKLGEGIFGNSSSGLSVSHHLDDPRLELNYGGIHKVKISQVKESEDIMRSSLGHGYDGVDNKAMSTPHSFANVENNCMPVTLGYSKGDRNVMTSGETYDSENNIFISMGQPYGRMNGDLSSGQASKDDKNAISMVPTFGKGDFISMGSQPFVRDVENPMPLGHAFNEVTGSESLIAQTYGNSDNGCITMCHPRSRGESTIISFGGYDDTDANARLVSRYELFASQPTFHLSEANSDDPLVNSSVDMLITDGHAASTGTANNSGKKDDLKSSKKASSNSFPSNVRSLLSTGMLDGVSVKYIAWSREKELRGVIKGTGYLCGCPTCNLSKVVNAYEFERHANCKTKHPNNHIYFENGKTIYGIVQELRSTPQNMLFDVIQTITGSTINQKSFRLWKDSFQAATRELQRIYGKEQGQAFT